MEGTTNKLTFVQGLAEHNARIDGNQLSSDVKRMLKGSILDTLGGIIGAWRTGELKAVINSLEDIGGEPEVTMWLDGKKLPASTVGLILGMLDSYLEFSGSTSSVVTSITLGEKYDRSGLEVLEGMVASNDIGESVTLLLASEYEAHKLHWPAQTMAYSTTAAACKMSKADKARTAAALSLAGCLTPVAPFEAFIQGAQSKVFYGGWPLMIGLLAERLSKTGCSGPLNVFEGTRGLGIAWKHRPVTEEEYTDVLIHEIAYAVEGSHKYYASNLCAHPTLNALQQLMEQHPEITAQNVASVEVLTYEYALALSDTSPADTRIAAHVSIPYLVAAMITDGKVWPEQTDPKHLSDENIRKLAANVKTGLYPGADSALSKRKSRPSRVTVTMKNGDVFSNEVQSPRWTSKEPPTDAEIEEKFRKLVGDSISADRLDKVVNMIWHLDELPSVRPLVELLKIEE